MEYRFKMGKEVGRWHKANSEDEYDKAAAAFFEIAKDDPETRSERITLTFGDGAKMQYRRSGK